MENGAKGAKIVALYVFPAIILVLMTILFVVPIPVQTGTLAGNLAVGPICPVEREDVPCPVPAQAYTTRTILIYPHGSQILAASLHPSSDGSYSIELPVNSYVVTLSKNGMDSSSDVPKTIKINKNMTTRLDISVDTGIR